MLINNKYDAISFLIHNSKHFLNIITKVKQAFNYGRGDKTVCKLFNYMYNNNNRIYNKYNLMHIGKTANSHSWDYINRNRDKFYRQDCNGNFVNFDDIDLEIIGYYKIGLLVIKIYEKIKFILKNKKNGLTKNKCVKVNITKFVPFLLAWNNKKLFGQLCFDEYELIDIFKNATGNMFSIYLEHLDKITDNIDSHLLNGHNKHINPAHYARCFISIDKISKTINKYINSPIGTMFRLTGNSDSTDPNDDTFFPTESTYSMKGSTLEISFKVNQTFIKKSGINSSDIFYTLMINATGEDCQFREIDIGTLFDKKLISGNTNKITLKKKFSYFGLNPSTDYSFDLSKEDVWRAFKFSAKPTNFSNMKIMVVAIDTVKQSIISLGMKIPNPGTTNCYVNNEPADNDIFNVDATKNWETNDEKGSVSWYSNSDSSSTIYFDYSSGHWVYQDKSGKYQNNLESNYWTTNSNKHPPLIPPLYNWPTESTIFKIDKVTIGDQTITINYSD